MTVALDRDAGVAPLVEVASAREAVEPVISPNMRTRDPPHVRGNCTLLLGNQNQVPVIRHQGESQEMDLEPSSGFDEKRDKCFVVSGLSEDGRATVSPVHDVLDDARFVDAADSRHEWEPPTRRTRHIWCQVRGACEGAKLGRNAEKESVTFSAALASARGEENVATPLQAMRLMEMLHRGEAVNRAVSDAVLATLELPKSSPIPRLLPPELRIANKPGGIEGASCD